MKELKHKPKILQSAPKVGQETNVKLYHKLIDGWAVEIIEVYNHVLVLKSLINLFMYHSLQMCTTNVLFLQLIDKELSEKILRETSSAKPSETTRTMRQIFTLGELSQICPHRINKKMFLLMQSIIFQQVLISCYYTTMLCLKFGGYNCSIEK